MSAAEAAEPQEQEEPKGKTAQLPLFEGHRVTEHRLNFGGNVPITGEVAKEMKLGAEVTLTIKGYVTSRNHKGLKDKDGNRLGASSSAALIVQSVEIADE